MCILRGVLNGFLSIYRDFLNKYLLKRKSFEEEGDEVHFYNQYSYAVNVTVFDVIKQT
jgi:hypothetical protein